MASLGIHRGFLREYAKLEKTVQRHVEDVFVKFSEHTHAGLHLEKLQSTADPRVRTIRVTKFYRGVVLHEGGDSYLLLTVLPHDDAIEWAKRYSASTNIATHGIELRNDVALEQVTPGLEALAAAEPTRLFADVSDADMRRLGIEDQVREKARLLTSADQLDALKNILPEQQYEVLFWLADGMSPEVVWAEVVTAQAGTSVAGTVDELDQAMARSQGRIVRVTTSDDLREIFAKPFDEWRIYLHTSQKSLASKPYYNGPVKVSGGPGTGKTVVALHRARYLAERAAPGTRPILLTTLTKNLAAELSRNLDLLVADPNVRGRIRVEYIHEVAEKIFRDHVDARPRFADNGDLARRWARVVREHQIPLPPSYMDAEWQHVVLAQQVRSLADYLLADRDGRGRQLKVKQKSAVWRAVQDFQDGLRRDGLRTFIEICEDAANALRDKPKPFSHVIVDEAQDLHPAQWRLLRALVSPGPNDLFISGDTHQRIYRNKASLSSLGIRVVGRSYKLRVSYRTTREILAWSIALLTGTSVDDLDDGTDDLAGYRSTTHGARPELHSARTEAEELDAVVRRIREWLAAGVAAEEIGVALRSNNLAANLVKRLDTAGISAVQLPRRSRGVRVGTMHGVKGLEFRCMAVAGVNEGLLPLRKALTDKEVDPVQHSDDLTAELCLLFVACTRARDDLYVSWHGKPSRFLEPVLG